LVLSETVSATTGLSGLGFDSIIKEDDIQQRMASKLKRTYLNLLIPAIAGFIIVLFIRQFNMVHPGLYHVPMALAPIIFVLSVVFAVALPIFYRTLFANKIRHQTNTSETDWLKFEQNLIRIALVTPYLTLSAYFFQVPEFHLAGSTLAALYAVYYFYPSEKRIAFERRIFKVK